MELAGAGRSTPESVLRALALASTTLHPDDIPLLVAEEMSRAGLGEAVIYVACLEQRELIALGPAPDQGPHRFAIEDCPGAIAYRTERPTEEPDTPGGFCTWFPLMDSAERLGVMSLRTQAALSESEMKGCVAIANVAAELVANKQDYGDSITQTRRTRPLTLSAELRWSMLPPLTFTGHNLTISGIVAPPYEIAGDTFDYAVNGDTAHIMIMDAVGHGLEAARIASLAVGTYRHSRRANAGLQATYSDMNQALVEQFGPEKFATAQLAEADVPSGRVVWVNAGHPNPMVIRQGRRVDLSSEVCLPVGLAEPDRGAPPVSEAQLEPGDLVIFFTDGVVEARSAGGVEFGRDRLGAVLERAAAAGDKPAETLRLVSHELFVHQQDALTDDATLLMLAWDGPPESL